MLHYVYVCVCIHVHGVQVALRLRKAGGSLGKVDENTAAGELCDLAHKGDLEGLKLLVTCGGDVNAGDYDRRRCLHLSASEGHKLIVDYLVEQGAEVNAKDRYEEAHGSNTAHTLSHSSVRTTTLCTAHGAG